MLKHIILVFLFQILNLSGYSAELRDLPDELQILILGKLPVIDIISTCSSEKKYRALYESNYKTLWLLLLDRDFGQQLSG